MTKCQANKQLCTFKDDISIIIDTREKKIDHITKFMSDNNINYNDKIKLNTGDYSFIYKDKDYRNIFSIDRKQHINELMSNFCEKRFINELRRGLEFEYFKFVIESGALADIYNGNYRSNMNKKSAIGMIETWKLRGIQFEFIENINFAKYLISNIYYFVRNELIK